MKSRSLRLLIVIPLAVVAMAPTARANTTWYVNGVSGSDTNNCASALSACKTIGHVISQALSGDSIIVAAATYSENLNIGFSLNLIGSGANTTIIDGGGRAGVVGISNNSVVSISDVTIRNGHNWYGEGGGIYNNARLTINASTITGNNSFISRNLCCGYGGGIFNDHNGTLTINNSTISANTAGSRCGLFNCPGNGGGIENLGRLVINNSTISGNYAYGVQASIYSRGGGIENFGGTLSISNSTISGNSGANGGGIYGIGFFQNTIVANNSLQNCYNQGGSSGYNLSSDGSCNFHNTGDMNNTNPELGPLQNNGGPTDTMALLPGSPAIDAGNPSGCTDGQGNLLKTDQRGMPRPDREDTRGCDIGAYESQSD